MNSSYRTILRSSAVMGAASVANILVGLVRMKVAAILLGPAGIGLIGLLQSLMGTAAGLASLGFGSVGTRQIAEADGSGRADDVAVARRALFWGTMGLASLGGFVFFLLRDQLAARVVDDPLRASEIGWLAIGVVLSVASASQNALLNGLRRIGDLARLQVASGLLSTVIGVGVLLLWRQNGVVLFLIATPLASFVLGHWFVSRLGRVEGGPTPLRVLAGQWRTMATLGAAFMVSSLAGTVGQLLARSIVQHELGSASLGQFQAAWAISMTYLGFVLQAMATDYYPRLTAAIGNRVDASRLVNEQTEVALLLAGPALIAMMALAPWVVRLLYSHEFDPASHILRWQVLGDVLKIASWPLGFVLLAAGAARALIFTEVLAAGIFILGIWVGIPYLGIEATGVSFLAMYLVHLSLTFLLARRRIGFAWQRAVVWQMIGLALAAVTVLALSHVSEMSALLVGCALAGLFGLFGLGRLGSMANLKGPVGRLAGLSRKMVSIVGVRVG